MKKNLKQALTLLLLCEMLTSVMMLASCNLFGGVDTQEEKATDVPTETESEAETTRGPMAVVTKPPQTEESPTTENKPSEPTPPADTETSVEPNPGVGEIIDWEE